MRQAIVLIGSLLINKGGRWQTAGFEKKDVPGSTGGKLRVLAAYRLYKDRPQTIIILSGRRKEKKFRKDPLIASTMKAELIKLGVPAKEMILDNKSSNTYYNLVNLIQIVKNEELGKINIISNEYHLPRIKAMIKYGPKLKELNRITKIKYSSAESVLIKNYPKLWKSAIKRAYAGQTVKNILAKERKGIKDIKNGSYKYN